MSGGSTSAGDWSTRIDPVRRPDDLPGRADDPRLGECVAFWDGGPLDLWPGRPVLLGFPQDEGVRRNGGRVGAADAPRAIRHWFYRLTPWDGAGDADLTALRLLDLGNVRITENLEATQQALGEVVGGLLAAGAVPVVLGGGHETAYGHYLGYVRARRPAAVINLDAHLDVRPFPRGGHNGSPFRQALEHPHQPLRGYVCLGAQPFSVSREHLLYLRRRGGAVRWCAETSGRLDSLLTEECRRLVTAGCQVQVSIDADVVRGAEVPGVSAPNPLGLAASEVAGCARLAGATAGVSSLDLVEINPQLDDDGRSARWAAVVLWHFLAGLCRRPTEQAG